MLTVLYLIEIAVALGLIIFVHELGHFLAAKGFGVWVRRFAIGFGPPIVAWTRGRTEYSLRCIPLGGFVEPMGDEPDSEGGDDPKALWRLPAWQKSVIFAAGVVMNVIMAIILFTVASMVGIMAPAPLVGEVAEGSPAAQAGIQPMDRIVEISGEAVHSFLDIQTIIMAEDTDTPFEVTVLRPGARGEAPARLVFRDVRSRKTAGDLAPAIGVRPVIAARASKVIPASPEEQAGLKDGDRIVALNGQAVGHWKDLKARVEALPAGPFTLAVERAGKPIDLAIDPASLHTLDLGVEPATQIHDVREESPAAKAGLLKGDVIARIADVSWPKPEELKAVIKAAGAGGQVVITVLRDGQSQELECGISADNEEGEPRIGIAHGPAQGPPLIIGKVADGGPAAKAGLAPGDAILSAAAAEATTEKQPGQVPAKTWDTLVALAETAAGHQVQLRVRRGDQEMSTSLAAIEVPVERVTLDGVLAGDLLDELMPRTYNPIRAAGWG
ncbi:MAG: RIP metalloprotease RseP, partial [Planctomycetes bacterium]|nr:RIP metalloprotease RseP [Planctomycetota bacterium]